MEAFPIYHRVDPRRATNNATTTRVQPGGLPLPNINKRTGIKRKPCDSYEPPEAKRRPATNNGHNRSYVKVKPLDPLLSLRNELAWMREQERKSSMRMHAWTEGDHVWPGCDISKVQRAEIVNWLVVLHSDMKLEQNTLFVAVNLLDRVIQKGCISKKAWRPVALSCLWIAAKISDYYYHIPKECRLMEILGQEHTLDELHVSERMVLKAVGFNLWRPTALQFAEKYASVLKPELVASIKGKMHSALELSFRDINMSTRNPSEVGISALSYALGLETDHVASKLKDISGYDVHSMYKLVKSICNAAFDTFKGRESDPIFNKYPKAFVPQNNAFLSFRVTAYRKKEHM